MPRHIRFLAGTRIRKSALLLSVIFTLVFSLAPLARAQDADDEDGHDSHARIVRISYVEGEVRLDNGHGYESVTMNVPVTEHNWLQTRSDGWAEVQLEDGSLIRLAPDTVIAFTELGRLSTGGTVTTVDLDQGEAEFKIIKRDDSDFQVTVKNKTIALTHTGSFRVTSTNADPMEIVVWKGDVSVHDPESGSDVTVNKNETFVLDTNDVSRYALDKGTEADDLDQWSKQRDDYLSTYASGRNYSQSPYQYGVSDLNQYGQYYDVPGYGNVWQPTGVGLGWDPFSNGYWNYSPGFGYTWVSSYPWGWMPYRYGRWVFVGGRGWCWAPGGWNRWYSRPRIASAPPGFHAPTPPPVRIVGGAPGRVNHSGTPSGNGGAGGRSSGAGGSRQGDRDGDNRAVGNRGGNRQDDNRGNRHVLTNDDVQGKVPRTDVPAQSQPPAVVDADRRPDRTPRTVEQEPAGGGRVSGRFGGDREPRTPGNRSPESRSNDAPPTPQPSRQSGPPQSYSPPNRQPEQQTPPPQSYSPPNRQPEHQAPPPQSYSPPNRQPEHQAPQPAPAPPPPAVHQPAPPAAAPAQHQSPPPESHVRQSDDSSRGKPK